jgi:tRNA dimethylallyltransferase
MMEDGLFEEAKQFYVYRNLNPLNTVGYKEIFDYMDGKITLEQAVEKIKQNTRHYAKRQLTWFNHDKDIEWFHPDRKEEITVSYKTDFSQLQKNVHYNIIFPFSRTILLAST